MARESGARFVVAILVLSLLATPSLADDDAGTGGDAGDSSAAATPLGATNATYYGNLTSSDEDWYSIQMPNGTALAASLYGYSTSNDFDLYLYDSSGASIDYSWYADPNEEVTSNGTSIGGTTVRLWVDAFSGSGGYTLEIWIFTEPQGPPQDDAGTGGDAGDSSSTATYLSSSNQTVSGWISETWDNQDWYNISIPAGHGIYASMTFPNGTSSNTQLALIESSATFYINSDYSAPYGVTSNGTNVAGDSVFIRIITPSPGSSTGDEGYYNLTISLFSTSGQPGSSQNDANSGGDAGDTLASALAINMTGNQSTFTGWVDESWDSTDYYSVDIPANWTTWASLSWGNSSADLDLYLYSSTGSTIDSGAGFDNPEMASGNSSSVGGTTVYYRVYTYSGYDVYYNLTISLANLSNTPAYNQNDANSGGDAGDDFSDALNLTGNGTYFGWISDTSDNNDVYAVQIPSGHAIEASLSWNNSNNDFDLALYDSGQAQIDSSLSNNPEMVQSGTTDVSNTTVYVLVQSTSGWWSNGGEGDYILNISLVNQSQVPGLNQDDAYSGGDAGDSLAEATPINANPVFSIWPGYADSNDDTYDYYFVNVPVDHGITVELSPGYTADTWYILSLLDNTNNVVDSDYYSDPQSVSVNGTGTYLGGSDAYIEVLAYSGDGSYNLSVWIFSLDADGDGYYDEDEYSCGSDPFDNSSIPSDIDADGLCDGLDEDMDGDGVDNANDTFPEDGTETNDNDNDGTGDNADPDDDNDGWGDYDEFTCETDPNDSGSVPSDLDADGLCDLVDSDIDGDGYDNPEDSFDEDPLEWNDTDDDGIGDNSDDDDDGDGFYDGVEEDCLSDPMNPSSTPPDTDSDGVCDELDDDVDGDGTTNDLDSSPFDPTEDTDTDGDGIGDNADPDDDNDGYQDEFDAFPLEVSEWADNDNDGTGNNADPDDDNDGWLDSEEEDCNTNSFSTSSIPTDSDGDHICDLVDPDDDNDGWDDTMDSFQFDPNEWDDLDADGKGSNIADDDDDGDGWDDLEELSICGTDPRDQFSVPNDFDGDHICDNEDDDDDNDGVLDVDDPFPHDPNESKDTDGDGIGDNGDSDDDNDGWADATEVVCETPILDGSEFPDDTDGDGTCDLIDPDDDNDGIIDLDDAFPFDANEWVDRNGDGFGDNGKPLTTMDHMRLNPEITIVAIGTVSAFASAAVAFAVGSKKRRKWEYIEGHSEPEFEDEYYEDWSEEY